MSSISISELIKYQTGHHGPALLTTFLSFYTQSCNNSSPFFLILSIFWSLYHIVILSKSMIIKVKQFSHELQRHIMDIITQSVSFSVCRNKLTVERRQSFIDIDGKIEAAMVGIKLDFHKLPTMIYTLGIYNWYFVLWIWWFKACNDPIMYTSAVLVWVWGLRLW